MHSWSRAAWLRINILNPAHRIEYNSLPTASALSRMEYHRLRTSHVDLLESNESGQLIAQPAESIWYNRKERLMKILIENRGRKFCCQGRHLIFFHVILFSLLLHLLPANASVFLPEPEEVNKAEAQDREFQQQELDNLISQAAPGADYIQIDDMRFKINSLIQNAAFSGSKWPYGIIYYTFDTNVTAENKQRWLAAAAEWSGVAHLFFFPRTAEPNYIYVQNDDKSNNSEVGMQGGKQEMNIKDWEERFIIAHEIGHALGLIHEHCRADRDDYVTILWDNIQAEKEENFIKISTGSYGAYDFDSVMHYPKNAFYRDNNPNLNTIEPLPPYSSWLDTMGQRNHLSDLDKTGMAIRYGYDDAYEENDTLSKAYDLSNHKGTWLSSIGGKGVQADDDWYKIYEPAVSAGSRIVIDLRFTHAEGDIDMYLIDIDGDLVAGSFSMDDNERIDYRISELNRDVPGYYLLKVYYSNAGNAYDLRWNIIRPTITPALMLLLDDFQPATTFQPTTIAPVLMLLLDD